MSKAKIFPVSLGCSKNHCDLEHMLGILRESGYEITLSEDEADVALINTCGFIESAKQEAIDEIIETAKLKEKNLKKLIVSGCLAQRYSDEILKLLPEADAVVGVFCYDKIDKITEAALNGVRKAYISKSDAEAFDSLPRIQTTPYYYSYLKIAEGCDNRCSYCVIPKIRGGYRSVPVESLVEEARTLAANGVSELIIIAQDVTRYGIDLYKKKMLIPLLDKLSEIEGIKWIRLHYLYPEMVDDELICYIAKNKKVLNYFDIPIQHINDRVLTAMNRRTTGKEIKALIKKIRDKIPDAAIRTTLIAGFPTETEEEFNELAEFVREADFDRLGAFAYSREEGTKAYSMRPQIPQKEKERRRDAVMAVQREISAKKNAEEIGKKYEVLVEGRQDGVYFGRTYKDSVEIDGTVMFESSREIEFGEYVTVLITGAEEYDLIGREED